MSLKSFHIFFIVFSALACFAFATWCWRPEVIDEVSGSRVMGGMSLAAGVALVVYGALFVVKVARKDPR